MWNGSIRTSSNDVTSSVCGGGPADIAGGVGRGARGRRDREGRKSTTDPYSGTIDSMYDRLKTLGGMLAFAMGALSSNAQEQLMDTRGEPSRPNVVLILADDLGYGDIGRYGGRARTPHLDRLAGEGLVFSDFHANGPVCSPTRAALLTGRYQQRMGIDNALGEGQTGLGHPRAKGEITVAEYLRRAGYRTGIVGKWHLGYEPEQNPLNFGFDEFRGMLHGAVDYHSHVNTFGRFDWWHDRSLVKEEGYVTDLITEHSLSFLERHRKVPFFLFVSHLAIHSPWQTPDDVGQREVGKKYRDVSGPLNKLGPHPPDKAGAAVRRMIEEMDKGVGRITAKLRELGLAENTLVFFTSDNGGIREYRGGYYDISSNGPLRGGKGALSEGGHRVPAIAAWPGCIRAGITTSETALTMDLLPTLLLLAGAPLPAEDGPNRLDGTSLSSLLLGGQSLPPRTVFWAAHNSLAVRSGSWKLLVEPGSDSRLYDLDTDIAESRDLAGLYPERVAAMEAELHAWRGEVAGGVP